MEKEYEKRDYNQEALSSVNSALVTQLKQCIEGVEKAQAEGKEWDKPFFTMPAPAYNPYTGTQYSGINRLILANSKNFRGDGRFYTYNNITQIEEKRQSVVKEKEKLAEYAKSPSYNAKTYEEKAGKLEEKITELEKYGVHDINKPFHLKKSSKSDTVYKSLQRTAISKAISGGNEDSEALELSGTDENGLKVSSWYVYAYAGNVFNACLIENISPLPDRGLQHDPIELAEIHAQAMIAKTGLRIEEGNSSRAFYRGSEHMIAMPAKSAFKSAREFYDTLNHEIAHSTGDALGRVKGKTFGDEAYAKEELVAEMTSIMMAQELGLPHNSMCDENHLAYMKSWISSIEGTEGKAKNEKLLTSAFVQAARSFDYQNAIRNEFMAEQSLEKSKSKEQVQENVKVQTQAVESSNKKSTSIPKDKPKQKEEEIQLSMQ